MDNNFSNASHRRFASDNLATFRGRFARLWRFRPVSLVAHLWSTIGFGTRNTRRHISVDYLLTLPSHAMSRDPGVVRIIRGDSLRRSCFCCTAAVRRWALAWSGCWRRRRLLYCLILFGLVFAVSTAWAGVRGSRSEWG